MSGRLSLRTASVIGAVAALACFSDGAFACSLAEDYQGPRTNFELVQQADTILIGTLEKSMGTDVFDHSITVKPTVLLKGANLPKTVTITGFLSDRPIMLPDNEIRVRVAKSEPLDLWRPHPEVWMGGCSRSSFDKGMQLVLFFKRKGNELRQLDPAFTRSSEDVSGPDALWVRAVELYVRVGQLPIAEQNPALKAEMERLRESALGDDEPKLLADDIERQIIGCGPVSDFWVTQDKCHKPQWAYNIANAMYHGKPPLPETIDKLQKRTQDWFFWFAIAGIISLIALVAGTILIRKRKTKAA